MNKELASKKWEKLIKMIKGFQHIPFVDFVFVAGSMATGDIHPDSDFDVIIGARQNRIFTVRQLTAGFFSLTGGRRSGRDSKKEAKDKLCFNHFVSPGGYKLDPPYNEYWVYLYQNLVPVYGKKKHIQEFLDVNDWAGEINLDYEQLIDKNDSFWKRFLEKLLSNKFGDLVENIFKKYQLRRINKGLKESKGYKPQIVIDDNELRFHMDTKRIEKWLEENK